MNQRLPRSTVRQVDFRRWSRLITALLLTNPGELGVGS
jgi:hypothetical protein